jgi:hypothetical protein
MYLVASRGSKGRALGNVDRCLIILGLDCVGDVDGGLTYQIHAGYPVIHTSGNAMSWAPL